MTIDEKLEILHDSIKGLEVIATAHQGSIEAHDRQIADLLTIVEQHSQQIAALNVAIEKQGQQIADQARQWQAYINTLPRQ